jgi:hypothetical protein
MPGPPLTESSLVAYLLAHNVTVGIGIQEIWQARNTRFDAGWVSIDDGFIAGRYIILILFKRQPLTPMTSSALKTPWPLFPQTSKFYWVSKVGTQTWWHLSVETF